MVNSSCIDLPPVCYYLCFILVSDICNVVGDTHRCGDYAECLVLNSSHYECKCHRGYMLKDNKCVEKGKSFKISFLVVLSLLEAPFRGPLEALSKQSYQETAAFHSICAAKITFLSFTLVFQKREFYATHQNLFIGVTERVSKVGFLAIFLESGY